MTTSPVQGSVPAKTFTRVNWFPPPLYMRTAEKHKEELQEVISLAPTDLYNQHITFSQEEVLHFSDDDRKYFRAFANNFGIPTLALRQANLTWPWRANRRQDISFANYEDAIKEQVHDIHQGVLANVATLKAQRGNTGELRDYEKTYNPKLQKTKQETTRDETEQALKDILEEIQAESGV